MFEGVEEVSSGDHQLFGSLKINFNFGVSFHLSKVKFLVYITRNIYFYQSIEGTTLSRPD